MLSMMPRNLSKSLLAQFLFFVLIIVDVLILISFFFKAAQYISTLDVAFYEVFIFLKVVGFFLAGLSEFFRVRYVFLVVNERESSYPSALKSIRWSNFAI